MTKLLAEDASTLEINRIWKHCEDRWSKECPSVLIAEDYPKLLDAYLGMLCGANSIMESIGIKGGDFVEQFDKLVLVVKGRNHLSSDQA